jgi:hypothetical protein
MLVQAYHRVLNPGLAYPPYQLQKLFRLVAQLTGFLLGQANPQSSEN